jgi:hypothetical protein
MLLNKPSGELFGLLICTKAQLIYNHCCICKSWRGINYFHKWLQCVQRAEKQWGSGFPVLKTIGVCSQEEGFSLPNVYKPS